ncbi:MAG: hypothetical protein ACTTJH_02110 [Bacteroidales bacterium]
MIKRLFCAIILVCIFTACRKGDIVIKFDPMANFPQQKEVCLDFDMTNSVFEGLTLPNKDSFFEFTFTISNENSRKYYYKIFYQNTSYAFRDDHPLSYENFYGSWENTNIEFKEAKGNTIKDSIRIVGNPRNEIKYFGKPFPKQSKKEDILKSFVTIKNNKQWYADIVKKAKENKVTEQEQMYKDLLWNLENENNFIGEINRRERRNPRVGSYEFMLVVVEENALKQIPNYIKNISKIKDSVFVNPFDFFLNKQGKNMKGVYVVVSSKRLKARAKFDIAKGVYINRMTYPYYDFNILANNPLVTDNDSAYYYSQFEEYYHNINTKRNILQIQKIADIQNNNYSLTDYLNDKQNKNILKKSTHPFITDIPGKNIRCHNSTIELINPASKNLKTARKENVGIKGRVGFCYGKYIYKIKFPALLNKSLLWNGLTNAVWLIYQNSSPWNYRRYSKGGYVKENYTENENERVHKTHYSEIDIEMVKTSKYWSSENKNDRKNQYNNSFIFASTNWDLACNDNHFIGKSLPFGKMFCKHLLFNRQYKGKTFTYNRWNDVYRNLSSRVELSNNIFLEPYYYYVIEWKPNEIIWYVGKDLKNLTVVGYMSSQFTEIPNNQMVPVITQEYHYSEFWPPVIFEQGNLPYQSEDTKGILYELIVE